MRRSAAFFFVIALGVAVLAPYASDQVCPRCGAPIEPGAAFCSRCGQKLDGAGKVMAAEAHSDPARSVVQVVAAHDKELTSTFGDIAYRSGVTVSSILGSAFAVSSGTFVTDASLLVGAKEVTL